MALGFESSVAKFSGPASVVAAGVGIVACRSIHWFGDQDSEAAISAELAQNNPIGWIFMLSFAALVALVLAVQISHGRWFHSVLLGLALAAIVVVASTDQSNPVHHNALILAITCLSGSTIWLGLSFRLLEVVAICSILASCLVGTLLLTLSGDLQLKPGWAEKLIFGVYAVLTVYLLNGGHPRYGWITKR